MRNATRKPEPQRRPERNTPRIPMPVRGEVTCAARGTPKAQSAPGTWVVIPTARPPLFLSFLKRPDSRQLSATRFQRQKRNERTKFSSTFAKDSEPHNSTRRGWLGLENAEAKKIGMRLSSAAGRLQPMRARRPSPFSRCTSAPETAESWQEPENCVGILDLQLERAL